MANDQKSNSITHSSVFQPILPYRTQSYAIVLAKVAHVVRQKIETGFKDTFYRHAEIVHWILFVVQYRRLFNKQILQEDNRLGFSAEYLSYLHRSKLQTNSCLKPREAQRYVRQWRISQRSWRRFKQFTESGILTMKMKAHVCSETSMTLNLLTKCNVPEDLKFQISIFVVKREQNHSYSDKSTNNFQKVKTAFEMWWHTRRNQISSFGETDEFI